MNPTSRRVAGKDSVGRNRQGPLGWFIFANGVMAFTLFSVMALPLIPFPLVFAVVLLAQIPLFILSLVLLPLTAWRGVTRHGMAKMDAWWWLSVPYSSAFQVGMRVFRPEGMGHNEPWFVLLWLIAVAASAAWMLGRIYQLAISRTVEWNNREALMIGLVILVPILLAMR